MEPNDDARELALRSDVRRDVGLASAELDHHVLRGVATFEHVALELPPPPRDLLGFEEDADVDGIPHRPFGERQQAFDDDDLGRLHDLVGPERARRGRRWAS
jgi:hypothetical protein